MHKIRTPLNKSQQLKISAQNSNSPQQISATNRALQTTYSRQTKPTNGPQSERINLAYNRQLLKETY